MQIRNPQTFDFRIAIGVQSTTLSGPLDPKWDIIIGGGVGPRHRKYFFINFADNGFGKDNTIANLHRPTRYPLFITFYGKSGDMVREDNEINKQFQR